MPTWDSFGNYYVNIRQSDPNVFGDQTYYEFSIVQTVAGFLGFVTGRVTNAITGNPIVGALIKSDNDVVTGSLPNGAYLLLHQPGVFEISGCGVEDADIDEDGIPDCMDRDIEDTGGGNKGDCFISTMRN